MALLAVIVGGLPLAITIIRRVLTGDQPILRLLLVPVVSFFVLVLYFGFVFLVGTGRVEIAGVARTVQPGNFPLGNRLLLAGLMLVFILGAIASTVAIWKAISRVNTQAETFRAGSQTVIVDVYKFAYIPAVVATFSMLVMLIATIIWSSLVFSALPQVFFGNYGLWQTGTQGWVYGIIAVMGVSSLAALRGILRGRSAMSIPITTFGPHLQ